MRGAARWGVMVLAVLGVLAGLPLGALAQSAPVLDLGSPGMNELWFEHDYPVVTGMAQRSFLFGPALRLKCDEPYREGGPRTDGTFAGKRPVVYLDKARLEETSATSVSSGLLAKELISGRRQMGDSDFTSHPPAQVPVAGDPVISDAPTYASFGRVATIADPTVNRAPSRVGQPVTETINRAGTVGTDASLTRYGVTLADYRDELGHNIPGVFVDFFNRPGLVAQYDENRRLTYWERSPLLISWAETMGLPVAEPYWARVPVGGQVTWVLMQPFERRVLTYTPDNDPAYRVEMGNIGLHYKTWRHPDGTCRE